MFNQVGPFAMSEMPRVEGDAEVAWNGWKRGGIKAGDNELIGPLTSFLAKNILNIIPSLFASRYMYVRWGKHRLSRLV
jgi:hypothetical protein